MARASFHIRRQLCSKKRCLNMSNVMYDHDGRSPFQYSVLGSSFGGCGCRDCRNRLIFRLQLATILTTAWPKPFIGILVAIGFGRQLEFCCRTSLLTVDLKMFCNDFNPLKWVYLSKLMSSWGSVGGLSASVIMALLCHLSTSKHQRIIHLLEWNSFHMIGVWNKSRVGLLTASQWWALLTYVVCKQPTFVLCWQAGSFRWLVNRADSRLGFSSTMKPDGYSLFIRNVNSHQLASL